MGNEEMNGIRKGVRESNLECLRIVAMLLVLLIHYVPSRMALTPSTAEEMPFTTLFELELRSICFVCVNVFILISGWFGIRHKRKSFMHLAVQILFWWAFGTIVGAIIWPGEFGLMKGVFFLIEILRQWFVFSYLGLYMLAPVLNAYIEKSTIKQLRWFVLIYWGFSTFFGYFCYGIWETPGDFNVGMSILSLVGLYFLGAYLKRVVDEGRNWLYGWSSWTYLVAYFVLGFVQTLFAYSLLRLGVKSSPYGYMNPIIMMESVCLFLFFAKLKMGYVGWINYLASSAFAVYLMHGHPAIWAHYRGFATWIEGSFSPALPVGLLYILGVFVVAVLIDKAWWWCYGRIGEFVRGRQTAELAE